MKKKTALAPEKTWKRGPEKEKTQITVRIPNELAAQVYDIMKATNMRITDMVERGLVLALQEEEQELPLLTSQVRFLVANTTKPEQEQLRDYLTFLRVNEVRAPSEEQIVAWRFILEYLKTFRSYRAQVMELYKRYGRTEAEIEKMTG